METQQAIETTPLNGKQYHLTEQRQVLPCGRHDMHPCLLTPDMLPTLWPWMRERLLRLQVKNPPRAHWLPEHVRAEIERGFARQSQAECFLAHDGRTETITGFVVTVPQNDPFVNLPLTWFMWMCTAEPGALMDCLPEIEAMARLRGYRRIEWLTSREGWERRVSKNGYSIVQYTIAKELV